MSEQGSGPSHLIGPADLLRALEGVDAADWSRVAGFLGYDLRSREPERGRGESESSEQYEPLRPPPLPPPDPRPPLRCWRVDHVEFSPHADAEANQTDRDGFFEHWYVLRPGLKIRLALPVDTSKREASALGEWISHLAYPPETVQGLGLSSGQAGLRADQVGRHAEDAKPIHVPALAPWPSLRGAIEQIAREARPLGDVDVDGLVDTIGRGDPIRRVPRRPRRVQGARIVVIVDRSDRLLPFWRDQEVVAGAMRRELGELGVEFVWWAEGLERPPSDEDALTLVEPMLAPGDAVLVLGDLGLHGEASDVEAWTRWGEALREAGVRTGALVPCPSDRWPEPLVRVWTPIAWADPGHARDPVHEGREVRRDRLWALLSWTVRCEASLLRAAGAALPSTIADEGTEADVWNHPDAQVFGYELVVSDGLRRKGWAELQAMMRDASWKSAIEAVIAVVREHHRGRARETLTEELRTLELLAPGEGWITASELERVRDFTQGVVATLSGKGGDVDVEELAEWTRHSTSERLPESDHPELVPMILDARARAGLVTAPPGYWLGQVPPPPGLPLRKWSVWQVHDRLVIRPESAPAPERGSLVVTMLARGGRVAVNGEEVVELDESGGEATLPDVEGFELSSDCVRYRVCRETRPEWAHAFGRDAFGLWATLRVGEVEQRMRWIVPGRFMMGSPKSEVGRFRDEGPQFRVIFAKGFWLADTPCTQEFWVAVMGSNPSRFEWPRRPVEQVSWQDAQAFIGRLREKLETLDVGLPSEARWEYACRAGMTTATYAGDLDLRGEHDAPVLDEIAWYGGNSGHHGFDLGDRGVDSSSWREKQYPHRRAAAREVATRRANPWGLYDMLGNIWEWCEDPDFAGQRAYRGGGWDSDARLVRAAFRDWLEPGNRYGNLGFRLALGQGTAPSTAAGERSDPAR